MIIKIKGGPGSGHHGHVGRPGKRGGSLPGKGGGSSGAAIPLYDTVDEIKGGVMGKGYFIRPDGKLIDISGEMEGGVDDHIGYTLASGNPEALGLDKKVVDRFVAAEKKYNAVSYGEPGYEEAEREYGEAYGALWKEIYGTGIVRVRAYKHTVVVDNVPVTPSGLRKLRNYILDNKIPSYKDGTYLWSDELTVSYNDIMEARGIRDLQRASHMRLFGY